MGEFVMFEYYYAFLASLPDAVGALMKQRKQTDVSVDRLQSAWEKVPETGSEACFEEDFKISAEEMDRLFHFCSRKGQVILLTSQDGRDRSKLLQELYQICSRSLSMRCVYVPGEPVLLEESFLDNICMGEPYLEDKFHQVLEQTDLEKDVKNFKEGIHRKVGRKGTAVSGGQRKRIAIARALYAQAEVLFIDGFTDQVDRETEDHMINQMLEKFDGVLFITSNSPQLVERVQTVI